MTTVVFVLGMRTGTVLISEREAIRAIEQFKVINDAAGLRFRSDASPDGRKASGSNKANVSRT